MRGFLKAIFAILKAILYDVLVGILDFVGAFGTGIFFYFMVIIIILKTTTATSNKNVTVMLSVFPLYALFALWGFAPQRWSATIVKGELEDSEKHVIKKSGYNAVLLVLFCILAFLIPPFGWIFGRAGKNVGEKEGSSQCRRQGLILMLVAAIAYITIAARVLVGELVSEPQS